MAVSTPLALDQLMLKVISIGGADPLPARYIINIVSGATGVDNPTSFDNIGSTDITISGGGGGSGGLTDVYPGSYPFSASSGTRVFADETTGNVHVTMPASPAEGDRVGVLLKRGTSASNQVQVFANSGQTIQDVLTWAANSSSTPAVLSVSNGRYYAEWAYSATLGAWDLVNIVGVANGNNAYTATTANFTVPSIGSNVTVTVGATGWMASGQTVFVATAGYYTVASIISGTQVSLTNTGDIGNAVPTTVITQPAAVSPGGVEGPTGGASYTTTAANFTQPAIASTVSVQVASTAWMVANEYLFVGGGGGVYQVSSITDGTHVVLQNIGGSLNASSGTTINSGSGVTATGQPGTATANAVTKTANYTIGALDDQIFCDTKTTGSFTLTLPSPAVRLPRLVIDSKQWFATNPLTIAPHASELINGASGSQTYSANGAILFVVTDGTNWFIR